MAYGCVYALTCSDNPGVYKIGMSTRPAKERAREMEGSSLQTYTVYKEVQTPTPREHENILHRLLANYRVRVDREFFKAPDMVIDTAFHAVDSAVNPSDEAVRISGWTFKSRRAPVKNTLLTPVSLSNNPWAEAGNGVKLVSFDQIDGYVDEDGIPLPTEEEYAIDIANSTVHWDFYFENTVIDRVDSEISFLSASDEELYADQPVNVSEIYTGSTSLFDLDRLSRPDNKYGWHLTMSIEFECITDDSLPYYTLELNTPRDITQFYRGYRSHPKNKNPYLVVPIVELSKRHVTFYAANQAYRNHYAPVVNIIGWKRR